MVKKIQYDESLSDAKYLESISRDLDKLADEIRHLSWSIKIDDIDYLQPESIIVRLEKVVKLFKIRMGYEPKPEPKKRPTKARNSKKNSRVAKRKRKTA